MGTAGRERQAFLFNSFKGGGGLRGPGVVLFISSKLKKKRNLLISVERREGGRAHNHSRVSESHASSDLGVFPSTVLRNSGGLVSIAYASPPQVASDHIPLYLRPACHAELPKVHWIDLSAGRLQRLL